MPENTTNRDPLLHLLGMMGEGTSDYITGMEADGQRQLLNSDTLPSKAPWDDLEALGFIPGDPVAGDDLFRHCTLPEGWRREGSDHAMWSSIVDDRGVERVAVFYKAAFYDRRAQASIVNPGSSLAYKAVYGDEEPGLPGQWDVFTEEERADFRQALTDYIAEAAEYPSRPEERVARVRALLAEVAR